MVIYGRQLAAGCPNACCRGARPAHHRADQSAEAATRPKGNSNVGNLTPRTLHAGYMSVDIQGARIHPVEAQRNGRVWHSGGE